MNFSQRIGQALDGALSLVAPVWASRRMEARARLEVLRKALSARGLDAGIPGRTSGRSLHRKQGPKDKTSADLEATRAQARDLFRSNAYARGVVNTIVANLVSKGIIPQARVIRQKKRDPDESFNDVAEGLWADWAEAADPTGKLSFYEQQQQSIRELYVAGEGLLLFGTPADGREIPLSTEIIPSERLAMKDEWGRKDGKKIVQGVQFGASGGIEGYWIYPNHPFDTGYSYQSAQPAFIPADRVIHFYEELEPGQVRGMTRFLTVANAFEAFMQWLDFVMIKERVASAFAVAITRSSGGWNTPISTGDATDTTDDAQNEIDYLEGGIIAHLKPGEGIEGVSSNVQGSQIEQLARLFLRLIARGLDVSYELVSRDLSKVTYLSARSGENQDRRHWEPQQEFLNRRVNVPVWREVQRAAYLAQLLPVRELTRRHLAVEFVRPGWPWIDPSKDVSSTIEAIRAGLRSPIEEIIQRGGDPRKILRDLGSFKAWAEEEGLELDLFGAKAATQPMSDESQPVKGTEDGEDGDAEAENSAEEKDAA